MVDIQEEKNILRRIIKLEKQKYTDDELNSMSEEVFSVLELTGIFQDAKTIFIYHGLRDEVSTSDFIAKWYKDKSFYLPIVKENGLVFRKYMPNTKFIISNLGILEPEGEDKNNYDDVDLIIVPGVAFDRYKNRLGRGKGYYDRFLSDVTIPKMGICFDFQLLDKIPTNANDVKMDYIISENDLIW